MSVSPPKYPEYSELTSRIRSFDGHSIASGQSPRDFALAGLYFVASPDLVRCFWCDGGLKNWNPIDVPWAVHVKYYPKCPYVKMHPNGPPTDDVTNNTRSDESATTVKNTVQSGQSGVVHYRIEPREIKARMDTQMVRYILDKGHSFDVVRRTIEKQITSTGDDFPNITSLLNAVYDMERHDILSSPAQLDIPSVQDETVVAQNVSSTPPVVPVARDVDRIPCTDAEHRRQQLIDENKKMKNIIMCKKCNSNYSCIMYLPCNHMIYCEKCNKEKVCAETCTLCSKKIRGMIKTFLS